MFLLSALLTLCQDRLCVARVAIVSDISRRRERRRYYKGSGVVNVSQAVRQGSLIFYQTHQDSGVGHIKEM